MRYANLSCTEFYSCYLQQCLSIDSFSYGTPGHDQKGHMNKVCPSVQKFLWNSLFSFFRELKMVLGAHVMLCMAESDVLEKMLYPQNGENRPSPGFFECVGKFSFFSQFFIFLSVWSIMKVCITVILLCLNKFHIWENSGF